MIAASRPRGIQSSIAWEERPCPIDARSVPPWTVTKDYRRVAQAQPVWRESECIESNSHVLIGNEHYMISADGLLMPAKKKQAPPDLRYFNKQ